MKECKKAISRASHKSIHSLIQISIILIKDLEDYQLLVKIWRR